jgi:hypothetical protein
MQSDTLHTAEHREHRDRELILLDLATSNNFVLEMPDAHSGKSVNSQTGMSTSDPTGGGGGGGLQSPSSGSGGVKIQDFDFKPYYQKYFVDNRMQFPLSLFFSSFFLV